MAAPTEAARPEVAAEVAVAPCPVAAAVVEVAAAAQPVAAAARVAAAAVKAAVVEVVAAARRRRRVRRHQRRRRRLLVRLHAVGDVEEHELEHLLLRRQRRVGLALGRERQRCSSLGGVAFATWKSLNSTRPHCMAAGVPTGVLKV